VPTIITPQSSFAINHRPTTGSISPYCWPNLWTFRRSNHSNRQKCRRRQPHSHLRPPRGTSANIRMRLIFPETRVIGLHFCRWRYGSIFIEICAVGSKRRISYVPECVLAVQGHPSLMILVPIESAYGLHISRSLWLSSYLAPFL